MKRALIGRAVLALGLTFGPVAWAQTAPPPAATSAPAVAPPNSLTVTAKRPGPPPPYASVEQAVKAYAKPSAHMAMIGRWKRHICPTAEGLKPDDNAEVVDRVDQVAALVGAPATAPTDICTPDVRIIFTAQPQAVVDQMAADQEERLGYHYNPGEAQRMAKVTRPIQAWYATATRDARGYLSLDACSTCSGGQGADGPRSFYTEGVEGDLGHGLTSEFAFVTIVVDTNKTAGESLSSLSDYVAMLALSQGGGPDACLDPRSIGSLFAADCDPGLKADALTREDMAYLTALYKVDESAMGFDVNFVRDAIVRQMQKDLSRH